MERSGKLWCFLRWLCGHNLCHLCVISTKVFALMIYSHKKARSVAPEESVADICALFNLRDRSSYIIYIHVYIYVKKIKTYFIYDKMCVYIVYIYTHTHTLSALQEGESRWRQKHFDRQNCGWFWLAVFTPVKLCVDVSANSSWLWHCFQWGIFA